MEKSVDTDYMQSKNETSKIPDIATTCKHSYISNDSEDKSTCKACYSVSKVCKKIASQEWSRDQKDSLKTIKLEKIRRHIGGSKYNVLKKDVTETGRKSVLRKTKIINRNVPDRLGKYIYSVRSDTKLLLSDCKLKGKSLSNECSNKSVLESFTEHSIANNLFDGFRGTRLSLLGTECLNNNEAVSLENNFESDLKSKNIFENFFDDCLGSTSKRKDASSQENVKLEGSGKSVSLESESANEKIFLENVERREEPKKSDSLERTPVKKKRETSTPVAPAKVKDHNDYYNSHKSIRHVCNYCQKIFKSNGKLNSHVFSHTGERPFDCSHCGKAFSSKFKLVRHLLIHSEIRKFVCQICDRTFLRNDHLKNHYKVHDPKKKMYKCPKENCDKEYSSLMSHKKHMAYHSVEDGHLKCLICNVKYETKEDILFHLKSHSGSRLFKSQTDKKFKCEFCERLFLTRKDVTRHLVVHTGERDFLCQFCPQRFGRKDHLVRHIKKSHGNEEISVKSEAEAKKVQETKRGSAAESKTGGKSKKSSTKRQTESTETHFLRGQDSDVSTKESSHGDAHHEEEECIGRTGTTTEIEKNLKTKRIVGNDGKASDFSEEKEPSSISSKRNPSSATTQILLQSVPNILIIPNNSIILLRNQSGPAKSSKSKKESKDEADGPVEMGPAVPGPGNGGRNELKEIFLGPAESASGSDGFGLNFGANIFQSDEFLDGDEFCNVQPNLIPNFVETDQIDLEMINQNDLLPRQEEVSLNSFLPAGDDSNAATLSTAGNSERLKLIDPEKKATENSDEEKSDFCGDIEKELFSGGNENLIPLTESILNDFKEDSSSAILTAENNGGLFGNINVMNQGNENCGFELLRNLLTSENPVLSPLPGFNQIFHNSNANSN